MTQIINFLTSNSLLDDERISVIKRPLFYGKYKFSLGFTPKIEDWFKFSEIKDYIISILIDSHLTANQRFFSFFLFSNNEELIKIISLNDYKFELKFLKIIDPKCYSLIQHPRPKPRKLFYNKFKFRIRFVEKFYPTHNEIINIRQHYIDIMTKLLYTCFVFNE